MKKWINLGCGGNILPLPWLNYDNDVDITKPLPFESASVDRILIEHCLEHTDSAHGMRFLIEAYRVLKPDGVIRICVPELTRLGYKAVQDICTNHGHQQIYSETSLSHFLRGAGFDPQKIRRTGRDPIDGHHVVIGIEKDDLETLRMEATK